jgi:AraC family transcriptional regulator
MRDPFVSSCSSWSIIGIVFVLVPEVTGKGLRTSKKKNTSGLNGSSLVGEQRRIEVVEDGGPISQHAPLLSSAPYAWDGGLLEEYSVAAGELPLRRYDNILIHLQTGAAARHVWRGAGKLYNTVAHTGSLHLLPPGAERSLVQHDQTDCTVLSLKPAFISGSLEGSLPGERLELVEKLAFEDNQIQRLMNALHAETKAGAPTGKLFGQSVFNALAIYLAQRYSASCPRLRSPRGGVPRARLKRVLDYIGANLDTDLSLLVLAEIAEMNLYYFARLFKQSTRLSPHRYVLDQRIKRAKELLHNSQMTVFEVSMRTGFTDQAHFTKVFRRLVGVTPTEYRAQV